MTVISKENTLFPLEKQCREDVWNRSWLVAVTLEGFFCKTGDESLFYFCLQGLERQIILPDLERECEQ